MAKAVLGWHFLNSDGKTANGEGIQIVAGQRLAIRGPIQLCERGYHASIRALDALQYAPGPIVCRVKLSGRIIHDTDKAVASVRTCLWIADAERTLHEFAIWCAEQAIESSRKCGYEPHMDSLKALQVKRLWLDDKATDDELAAAWAAARDAARAAARDAYNEQLETMLAKLETTPNPMKRVALEVSRG